MLNSYPPLSQSSGLPHIYALENRPLLKKFTKKPINPKRVFYVAGPGDAIKAHEHWSRNESDPTEVSITFSSQIEDYCQDVDAKLYMVCYHKRKDKLKDGKVTIEHLPKPWPKAKGVFYHLRELLYGLKLLWRAITFRADVAILDSGCTHFFWQSLFFIFGIKVIPVLHNSLWPSGFRPASFSANVISRLDRMFWRYIPVASLCVSPECARQIQLVTGPTHRPLVQIRAQFLGNYFKQIPSPPPHACQPFRIMFIGRVVRSKGVFDIIDMAEKIEQRAPGRVKWTICGTGDDLDKLNQVRNKKKLESVVDLKGWITLDDLLKVFENSHCSIVPTRSTFVEGLAMTAAESVLAGHPIITNPVVPALELFQEAAVECCTDDVDSYVSKILDLIDNPKWYQRMCDACPQLTKPFLDRKMGLCTVLKRVLNENLKETSNE